MQNWHEIEGTLTLAVAEGCIEFPTVFTVTFESNGSQFDSYSRCDLDRWALNGEDAGIQRAFEMFGKAEVERQARLAGEAWLENGGPTEWEEDQAAAAADYAREWRAA